MNTEKMKQKFAIACDLIDRAKYADPKMDWVSIDVNTYGGMTVSMWPTKEHRAELTRLLLGRYGKMEKTSYGAARFSFGDDDVVVLHGALECRIIGHKKVLKEEVISTGKMVEVEEPVYECLSPIAAEKANVQ